LEKPHTNTQNAVADQPSELRQWPVQMHLLNPNAPYLRGADLLLAADCVAFSMGNFHSRYLKGRSLAIACPKLDHGTDIYTEKLTAMIDGKSEYDYCNDDGSTLLWRFASACQERFSKSRAKSTCKTDDNQPFRRGSARPVGLI